MAMGGDGPWAISVMWSLTAVTLIFVILRVYTRVFVVKSYGVDDHVYNLAFGFLFFYTLFTTISAKYGFGQNMSDIKDLDDTAHAILFEAIGQTFAVVGMAVAKWSLGLFLLRLVKAQWHKIVIWISMGVLMAASISVCFVFWLFCRDRGSSYRPDGFVRQLTGGAVVSVLAGIDVLFYQGMVDLKHGTVATC